MDYPVEIQSKNIGGEDLDTVDARELWESLDVKTPFHKWISRRIEESLLVENKDYTSTDKIVHRENGANKSTKYTLSLDAAKHIAMLERSEKGYKVRQGFIDYEKNTRKKIMNLYQQQREIPKTTMASIAIRDTLDIGIMLEVPKHLAQIEAVKKAEEIAGIDYSHMLTTSKAMDDIQEHELFLEPSDIATRIGIDGSVQMRGRRVNAMLYEIGLQEKIAGSWEPVEQLRGKNVVIKHAWKKGGKSGYNLKWNVDFVIQQLEQEGLA